jgi:hypothetical protein
MLLVPNWIMCGTFLPLMGAIDDPFAGGRDQDLKA